VVAYDLIPAADHLGDITETPRLVAAAADCDLIVNLAVAHQDDVRPVLLYGEWCSLSCCSGHGLRAFMSAMAIDDDTPING
jgi:hypothetical protein